MEHNKDQRTFVDGAHEEMNKSKKKKTKALPIEHWHQIAIVLMLYDAVVAMGSYFVAIWLRFDCRYTEIPEQYLMAWAKFAPIYAIISIFVLWQFHLYQSIWRFASFAELKRVMGAQAVLSVCHTILITVIFRRMPISYYLIGAAIQFLLILAVRFAYRFVLLERSRRNHAMRREKTINVMLIGAGVAGQLILRDLNGKKDTNERVCCIIDDDKNKWGRYIDDIPIVGGRDEILLYAEKYKIDHIYLTMPSATAAQRRDILNICKATKCVLKSLPGVTDMVPENVKASTMREVAIEDLLGREPVQVNMEEIFGFVKGKVILVTGGGGSIGSELCRQIAQHQPKQLIVFDVYENNAHAIGLELKDKFPHLNVEILIGSVRDSRRINSVFEKYRPDIVYHAAAHKHVPLMEDSPCEAIKNNSIGTYKTAYAAMMNGCKKFVLISTDKAVNPTNIMGASKRLCEMIVQTFDRKIREGKIHELSPLSLHVRGEEDSVSSQILGDKVCTDFVAVRFGNVLGSNGSVVPRFQEQIARGGPVTVTHPDVIRYFMTIPEAVSLVLQAGVYAEGGEIFVLDMGSPVKIDTLARNLIRLSGLEPDVDIQIAYTGLRAGEKLFEEILMTEEGMKKSPNNLIYIGSPISFDADQFIQQLQQLMDAAYSEDENAIKSAVAGVVRTYQCR